MVPMLQTGKKIRKYYNSQSESNKACLIQAVEKSILYLPIQRLPRIPVNGDNRITQDVDMKFLATEGPRGRLLLAFTRFSFLRERSLKAGVIILGFKDILRTVADGFSGVVINPSGTCLCIFYNNGAWTIDDI
ncbi:MAG: SseB family protein [Sedimentisphaerales bacterium]|nr:SseB family protein [Sedimentisphaerales bacterium]